MRKRVCFIGDSHVAALRLAVNEDHASRFRSEMDIFGVRGEALRRTFLRGNTLRSNNDDVRKGFQFTGGSEFIDLDGYDSFCVVGCGTSLKAGIGICHSYSTHRFGLPQRQLVSSELFNLMLSTWFTRTIAHRTITMLAKATGKPIYLIANPLWSQSVLDLPQGAVLGEMAELGVIDDFAAWMSKGLEANFATKATIIPQPVSTRIGPCFTLPAYSFGSQRLTSEAIEHPKNDVSHMNAAYGREVLNAFFATIDEKATARVAAISGSR